MGGIMHWWWDVDPLHVRPVSIAAYPEVLGLSLTHSKCNKSR